MTLLFPRTPDFAVPSLQALHESRHDIVLVVTQPDRPRGRGRKIMPPPVKESAIRYGYDFLQPESVKPDSFHDLIAGFKPDLLVVVAFGQILPKQLIDIPPFKAINVHASLLPRYRGPAPIQWAIINGEKETGVTTMVMDEGLDTGDILLQQPVQISPEDTSATLHDKLAREGAGLLLETLEKLTTGKLIPKAQDPAAASYVPMLQKKDGHINWELPAKDIANFIRGINPWPGAFTFCGATRLKIYRSKSLDKETQGVPGTVLMSFPDEILVATGKGALLIEELQGVSGKCLATKDYLCGCSMETGTVLT
ncbi:MAG: methionyl-tRNA formyltransferase [Deltaproteobacteria bacterium]|nr:methionyl-tRNA formyltransferase [Deltaproteobacteria bacterium]